VEGLLRAGRSTESKELGEPGTGCPLVGGQVVSESGVPKQAEEALRAVLLSARFGALAGRYDERPSVPAEPRATRPTSGRRTEEVGSVEVGRGALVRHGRDSNSPDVS
jgi:hypothetical protein